MKLNWYSLSIKHIYSTRCRSNQYIWFLFFLFLINLVQLYCTTSVSPQLFSHWSSSSNGYSELTYYPSKAPFTNSRTSTLQYFANWMFLLRTSYRTRCTIARINRCMRFNLWSHQVSLKYWTCMHTIQTQPNAIEIIAMQRTNIYSTNFLQSFVYSQERCTIFKDSKIHWSCLCVCYTTMRLFLNVSNVILKRSTINVSVLFQFPCFATSVYILDTELFSTRYIFASIYGFVLS